jgi:PEGA domain
VKEPTLDQPRIWSAPQPKVQALPPSRKSRRSAWLKWAAAALAFCALAEAVVIALLAQRRWNAPAPPPAKIAEVNLETPDPGATVMVDGRSAGVTPLQLQIGPDIRSISVISPQSAPKQDSMVGSTGLQNKPEQAAGAGARPGNVLAAVSAPQRVGGIRLSSPIELEVFEGDKRLGSSAIGIVTAPAGRRELDLVNSALGFRSRQVVDIRGGQVISLVVSPPNGRININAVPWAEVLIDGKSVGETPIGNLSIPLGEHEIIFRHPQLGEQRRTAIVRSDAVTRVSATLQR